MKELVQFKDKLSRQGFDVQKDSYLRAEFIIDTCIVEFQVHYSEVYCVPIMILENAFDLEYDDLFCTLKLKWPFVEMTEHPVYSWPIPCISPCKTAEMLAELSNKESTLLAFISVCIKLFDCAKR